MHKWTKVEEDVLKRRYTTHTARELSWALAAEGYKRSLGAVKQKLHELGLRKETIMPFSRQLTKYCETGDIFLTKVERDFRRQGSPYIVACNDKGQQAVFCQPVNGYDISEPTLKWWVRWYRHPVKGTWPY